MSKRLLLLFVVAFALVGCSSGADSPVTPQGNYTPDTMDNIPVVGMSMQDDGSFSALGMLGAYELLINPETESAELFAKRTSAIGEGYIVSGLSFFTIAPCATCLKIAGLTLDPDGNAIITFAIAHPFPPGNTSEDPSASNRLDLDIFDLAMVIAPVDATATIYGNTGAGVYPDVCVGSDGYTTELAEVIGDTNALPFFLVIDDSAGTTSTYNKFGMGGSASFDVGFSLVTGFLRFDMYLTMGYGFSAKKPDRLEPKYYNPEFNRKAAWKVAVTPPGGATPVMGNTWDDNDTGTAYNVSVAVYDWQQGATVFTGLPEEFGDADADNVFAASEVLSVSVEVPGMNSALQSVTIATSGTGTPIDPLIYDVPVMNENQLAVGEYLGLVKVTDERATLTPADGRDFIIDTPDGGTLTNYEMPEYATYQTFTATVVVGATACYTIGDMALYYDGIAPDGTTGNPVPTEWDIDFDASCSMGATSYDWDLDGDGTYEGTGGPLYTGGFPAGTVAGTYNPVLRLNGDNSLTFASTTGIVVAPALYVRDNDLPGSAGATGTKADPFDSPFSANTASTGGEIIMVFGGVSSQIDYGPGSGSTSADPLWSVTNDGIRLQGYQGTCGEPPVFDINERRNCWFRISGDNFTLDGFEFRDFDSNTTSAGYELIDITADNATISHCMFHDFGYRYKSGYVIMALGVETDHIDGLTITNNLWYDGMGWLDWGTTYVFRSNYVDNQTIVNNTMYDIRRTSGSVVRMWGFRLDNPNATLNIRNNTLSYFRGGTSGTYGGVYGYADPNNTGLMTVYYSNAYDFSGGISHRFYNCTEDSTCLNVDPLFTAGQHLGVGSPLIDAGDPDTAYNDADGSRNDMGCYGGPGSDWDFQD